MTKTMERPVTKAKTATTVSPRNKLATIITEQNQLFIDRIDQINLIWTAVLCGEHLLFLGPPGVAKSMLIEDLCRRITDSTLFLYLMGKATMPAELFGPVSLSGLKQDVLRFNTKGHMPEATYAFLDEAFKGSSAILNSVLRIVNERKFINGGNEITVPLETMFAASNELPEGPELAALYDRILIRVQVPDFQLDSDFKQFVAMKVDARNSKLVTAVPATLTLAEVHRMKEEVAMLPIPDDVQDTLVTIRSRLAVEGLRGSPRRWGAALAAVQANAYLAGRDEATDEDLLVLRHILWNTPEEEKVVGKTVLLTVSPMADKVIELIDQVIGIDGELRSIMSGTHPRWKMVDSPSVVAEFQAKLKSLRTDIKMFMEGAGDTLAKNEAARGYKMVVGTIRLLSKEFIGTDD